MNCPWLEGKNLKQCGAVDSMVVLSGFELNTFCRKESFLFCPVRRIKLGLDEKKVSLDEYCLMRAETTGGVAMIKGPGFGPGYSEGGSA